MITIAETVAEVREQVKAWRKEGLSVGLVPTMGYLHEGHQSLIARACAENDRVVVSVFVNPTQFGPNEDLASYPRDLKHDAALCEETGAALIFHPTPEEMYPNGFCSYVDMDVLTKELCGLSRPVHFRGVCTVVSKLFHIVQPDRAYFGEKDAQQLDVIRFEHESPDCGLSHCPGSRRPGKKLPEHISESGRAEGSTGAQPQYFCRQKAGRVRRNRCTETGRYYEIYHCI